MATICRVIIMFVLILSSFFIQGQKVAVVLSGGGAKGLSHVGVLKALEEHDIPIDYITGTSMGAIVGGFYASGYSPEEIESILTSKEFVDLAQAGNELEMSYYFKSPPTNASWINVSFDIDKEQKKLKSKLPTSFRSLDNLDFSFLYFYSQASAAANDNFDSLYIPFRCIATDISSDQAIVLQSGKLGKAIRASMTFPFYFRPVSIDGKLLFDGGIYNNFPVDVAINEFNPDIIIGSKAVTNYQEAEQDDLLSQIQNLIVSETDYTIPSGKGVLVEPDLPSVALLDMSKAQEFIDSGYVAAIKKIGEIETMISRRLSPEIRKELRDQFNARKSPVIIDSVIVTGLKPNQARYVKKLLFRRFKYLTLDKVREGYYKLLSDINIKYIYPSLSYDRVSSFYILELEIQRADRFDSEFGG